MQGLSTQDRTLYWNYKTRFVYYKLRYDKLYEKILKTQKSTYLSDIQKDLERTYPHLPYFQRPQEGLLVLERILVAVSIYYQKMGYCQGLNFVVGAA